MTKREPGSLFYLATVRLPSTETMAQKEFHAPHWLQSGHLQTLWPVLFRQTIAPRFERQRLELENDFIDLDWYGPSNGPQLVTMLTGLQGSSSSHYTRGLAHHLAQHNIYSVVIHHRGCSDEPNWLNSSYHGGFTEDINTVSRMIKSKFPEVHHVAVGFSLGGNILLNYLAQQSTNCCIDAAVAISVPFDLAAGAARMERGLSQIYQSYLVGSMRRTITKKFKNNGWPVDRKQCQKARTFHQFDNAVTAPLNHFSNADDYYQQASCLSRLTAIRTPTLIVQARDDPLVPASAIPEKHQLSNSIQLEVSKHGGHVGFVCGRTPLTPRYWLEHRIHDFCLQKQ